MGYVPTMSVMTYVILYSMQRMQIGAFKPEAIWSNIVFAWFLIILEVGAAKLGFFLAGSTVPVLNVLATSGYKYFYVVGMVVVRLITAIDYIYYPFFAYLAASAAYADRRFMLHLPAQSQVQQQYGVQPSALHGHVIIGLAIAQIPICWLLTPWKTA